jgi:translation initiation factor 2 beta subunit (eIF-2beta)/eIF-5
MEKKMNQPIFQREEVCQCETCMPNDFLTGRMRFIVCSKCGNKRCPHATNHIYECTNSNDPGQKGSSWENYKL